ncbi:MAG: redox-sensing transcriptional repressor Rex [Armatimonadota bacterium]|jgi:redox-sensing transcriptional repressor
MTPRSKVPTPTLERLATYFAMLSDLKRRQIETISSADVAERTGINAAQFRKDLSYFGEFGRPGIGYAVDELYSRIAHILKIDKIQPVVLVGAGNLGRALMGYPALRAGSFQIVAAFDNDPAKIGRQLWDITVRDVAGLVHDNKAIGARLAIITVPAAAAQDVAGQLVAAGIHNILNFAPVVLRLPAEVVVRNVDFMQELAVLSFHLPSL